jgi:hypothetical protein
MADREVEIVYEGVDVETKLDQKSQIAIADRLQAALLRTYELRLKKGTITGTELAALQRLLQANGWALDPAKVPEGLKEKLTSKIDPKDFDDDDEPQVVGSIGVR